MEDFTNSAKRIHNYIGKLVSQKDDLPTSVAWAEVFGLDSKIAKTDPHDVQTKLSMLRTELDLLTSTMNGTPYESALYNPYIDRVRRVISVGNLAAPWSSYKGNIGPDTLLALRWCAAVLPDEPTADKSELDRLLSDISNLRTSIQDSSINVSIRDFVERQLEIIERAIHEYPMRGGSALNRAFTDAVDDMSAHVEELQETDSTDAHTLTELRKLWTDLRNTGGGEIVTNRLAEAMLGLYQKDKSLYESTKRFLDHQP